jgi:hypothetical protein
MDVNPFNSGESLAVARLVWILIFSDDGITRKESDQFQQTLKFLGLTDDDMEENLQKPEEESFEIVRNMPSKKRIECGKLLRLAFSSSLEKDINKLEMSKLNDILMRAELFRPDKNNRKRDIESF